MRRQATNAARSPGKEITSQHPQATSRAHSNKSNGTNGTNGAKASKLEFWISEGADEIFRRTPDIATALGPAIAAPVKPVVKLPFDEVMHVVDAVEKLVSDIFSTNIGEDGQLKVLKVMHKDMTERFLESAFDSEPESLFDELTNRTSNIAQALILHQVLVIGSCRRRWRGLSRSSSKRASSTMCVIS